MIQRIEWENHFKNSAEKIDNFYLKTRIEETETADFFDSPQRVITPTQLLKDVREQFLRDCLEFPHQAFLTLQKRLPLVAEYLILECFDKNLLDRNLFSKIFRDIYIYSKINNTIFFSLIRTDVMLKIFRYCNPNILMNIGDRTTLKKLPKKLKIYRGVAGWSFRKGKAGISWTLDKNIAKMFAKHNYGFFQCKSCYIIEAVVKKENLIAYIHKSGRNEHEVIVSPSKLLNHKKCSVKPPNDAHYREYSIT